jgi:UDP:flavonoid glycosyltransferase YjiC (YdhE family)
MRFLFSAHPAVGHLQPVAPMARELHRRGHDVRVATASSFQAQVRSLGLEPMAVGLDWSRASPEAVFPDLAGVDPWERYEWILRHVYTDQAARQTATDLLAAFRSWRPDAVIHQQMELGSLLAAELLEIPHASYGFGQGLVASDRELGGPAFAPLRASLGLDPDPDLIAGFRYLRFEFAPPSYLAPDAVRLPTTHHIRPEIGDYRPGGVAPAQVPALRRPAVVVTFGMSYNRTPGLFETAIEALAGEPVDVVVTVGVNRDPADLEPLPSNVRAVRYVPLSLLLPQADVTVCHGGFNTVIAAVEAGTPLVLVPIDSDQPARAARCVELGLGRIVEPAELSPERLRRDVRLVRRDPRYGEAMAAFRAELDALPSTADAADLLETLARGAGRERELPVLGTLAID